MLGAIEVWKKKKKKKKKKIGNYISVQIGTYLNDLFALAKAWFFL